MAKRSERSQASRTFRNMGGILHDAVDPTDLIHTENRLPVLEFLTSHVLRRFDVFISHASEDKNDLVRPLAEELKARSVKVWYDEFELKVGDGLRSKINEGLKESRYGIVVLSPWFFSKAWPQSELDGLVAKEMTGGKVILPLWHNVSHKDVLAYSPILADKVAICSASKSISELAAHLVKAMV